jgi:hypothetical protein
VQQLEAEEGKASSYTIMTKFGLIRYKANKVIDTFRV